VSTSTASKTALSLLRSPVRVLSAVVAALGLLTLAYAASAQEKKATPAPATKTAPQKTPSACKGLDEAACKGKAAECQWIAPKSGKQKPYCRLSPKGKKKTGAVRQGEPA